MNCCISWQNLTNEILRKDLISREWRKTDFSIHLICCSVKVLHCMLTCPHLFFKSVLINDSRLKFNQQLLWFYICLPSQITIKWFYFEEKKTTEWTLITVVEALSFQILASRRVDVDRVKVRHLLNLYFLLSQSKKNIQEENSDPFWQMFRFQKYKTDLLLSNLIEKEILLLVVVVFSLQWWTTEEEFLLCLIKNDSNAVHQQDKYASLTYRHFRSVGYLTMSISTFVFLVKWEEYVNSWMFN